MEAIHIQSKIRHNAEEQLSVLKELQVYEDSMKAKQHSNIDKSNDEYDDEPIQYANQRTNDVSTVDQHSLPDETLAQAGQEIQVDEEQERKRGNELYAAGKYIEAIQVYTRCIQLDGKSSLAYSNRAMTNLKVKDWKAAEADATLALRIDPDHIKSYQRRAAARVALGKILASLKDLRLAEHLVLQTMDDVTKRSSMLKSIKVEISKVERVRQQAIKRAPKHPVKIQSVHCKNTPNMSKDESESNTPKVEAVCENGKQKILATQKLLHPKHVKNWCQFEQMWKTITDSSQKVAFLNAMTPQKLLSLYKNGIEDPDMLLDLVQHLHETSSNISYLQSLSNIPSLDIVLMMMTPEQKDELQNSVDRILKTADTADKENIRSRFVSI